MYFPKSSCRVAENEPKRLLVVFSFKFLFLHQTETSRTFASEQSGTFTLWHVHVTRRGFTKHPGPSFPWMTFNQSSDTAKKKNSNFSVS